MDLSSDTIMGSKSLAEKTPLRADSGSLATSLHLIGLLLLHLIEYT